MHVCVKLCRVFARVCYVYGAVVVVQVIIFCEEKEYYLAALHAWHENVARCYRRSGRVGQRLFWLRL